MKKFKIGLQLYSVRHEMENDMNGTLAEVARMGYEYVEFAGYYGRSAVEVADMLARYGLKCLSVHQSPSLFVEKGQRAVNFLKTFGVKYVVVPWYGQDRLAGTAEWDDTKKLFFDVAGLLRANGMTLLYHNHDFEFQKVYDKFIFDRIFEEIPVIDPQIDTCWVNYAGINPCELIEKYAGRTEIVHLKDFVCTKLAMGPVYALIKSDGRDGKKASRDDNGFQFKPLGEGTQDFDAILAACEKSGTECLIVEQDESVGMSPLEAAARSRAFLRTKGL